MFRQTKIDDELSEKTAEVAAVIAEEGLRYVSDTSPGYRRKRSGTSSPAGGKRPSQQTKRHSQPRPRVIRKVARKQRSRSTS